MYGVELLLKIFEEYIRTDFYLSHVQNATNKLDKINTKIKDTIDLNIKILDTFINNLKDLYDNNYLISF